MGLLAWWVDVCHQQRSSSKYPQQPEYSDGYLWLQLAQGCNKFRNADGGCYYCWPARELELYGMILNKRARHLLLCIHVIGYASFEAVADHALVVESCSGIWSSEGKPLYLGDDLVPNRVLAPNQIISIQASNDGLFVIRMANKAIGIDVLINRPLMEVLWSPDSQRFALNVSDGGVVGGWFAKVYLIDESGGVNQIDIGSEVLRLANALPRCEEREDANIGVVSWLDGGKELLLVAEVPPHSSCRNMGALQGFRVSASTGVVVEHISERQLRQKWNATLGCRFSGDAE